MAKEIDVKEHIFVPKHEKVSEDEKKEILSKFNISLKQLPKISPKDPAIKELEVKPKDIIKVIRKSATAGDAIYYRVVSE